MKPAAYRDIRPEEISELNLPDGGLIKIIAGVAEIEGKTIPGPIQGISTEPLFLMFDSPQAAILLILLYRVITRLCILMRAVSLSVRSRSNAPGTTDGWGAFRGDCIEVNAGDEGAAFLVLAARPLREPVVQYGPFVMNTREEIEQAIADYKNGQLV